MTDKKLRFSQTISQTKQLKTILSVKFFSKNSKGFELCRLKALRGQNFIQIRTRTKNGVKKGNKQTKKE